MTGLLDSSCTRRRRQAPGAIIVLVTAAALAVPPGTPAGADEHPTGQIEAPSAEVIGFTTPFRKVTLATLQQGCIQEFAAQEGELVAPSALLVRLEADVQRTQTETTRLEAETTARIELARVNMEHARDRLERLLKLVSEGAVSDDELSDARAQADSTRLLFEVAQLEHRKAVLAHQLNRALLAQMEVRAPFAGYVTEHLKELGEAVEEREGILTLAQLDPLLISLDCPLELARSIQLGDRVQVRPLDPQWPTALGTVKFINRVADAASQTFKVKVVVPNRDAQLLAGLQVVACFPPRPADERDMELSANDCRPERTQSAPVARRARVPK